MQRATEEPKEEGLNLALCKEAALQGARAAKAAPLAAARGKADKDVGFHSIVGPADLAAQRAILEVLAADKQALFITEEDIQDPSLASRFVKNDRLKLLQTERVYIIDELDGSSSRDTGHYEWAVSIAEVDRLVHLSGVIYAPEISGGSLFFASKGRGAYLESGRKRSKLEVAVPAEIAQAYVVFGCNCVLNQYPAHQRLVCELGSAARTANMCGSCAISMALLAAGQVHAVVHPVQSVWDWAAGRCLVEEAGGRIIFYEMTAGDPAAQLIGRRIDQPELSHYDPAERRLGFVAAAPSLAEEIWERLSAQLTI